MDPTNSISEGVFSFNPKCKKNSKNRKAANEFADFKSEDWYKSFDSVWSKIEEKVNEEENKVISDLKSRVNEFVHSAESNTDTIPTVIMLTGVNMSDHKQLFKNIDGYILDQSNSFTATLWASECLNIRNMIESMVFEIETTQDKPDQEYDWEEDSDSEEQQHINLKRSNLTLPHLVNWFNNLDAGSREEPVKKKSKNENEVNASPRIIVIIPDFEAHDEKVLQDFILILSGYASKLPIVFMFGVASMISIVHDTLPNHVISKLSLEFFKTPSSKNFLNSVVESVLLTPDCPFIISGRVLKFLNDVFICYDFSLKGFITSLKFCVMDHFFESTSTKYCWPRKNLSTIINSLNPVELSELKKVPSFAELIEKRKRLNDKVPKTPQDYKNLICDKLGELHESIKVFYVGLHCLQILVQDLPQKPLGSDLRELYIKSMTSTITESKEYEECIKILGFSSKPALIEKLKKVMDSLKEPAAQSPIVEKCHRKVAGLLNKIEKASLTSNSAPKSPVKSPKKATLQTRGDLKNKFLADLKKEQMTDFEIARGEVLDTLTSGIMNELLIKLTKLPFHEALIYNKRNSVKERMIGMPRGALVRALATPQRGLQCNCCKLRDEAEVLKTMPDICIVYKLHLRWGTLINVYDWMQSFKAVVEPESEDDEISPEIHARFTQAVADLQFLGYIRHTNVKKDHVARLTFER